MDLKKNKKLLMKNNNIFYSDEIMDELKSYGTLPDGWDFGKGLAPSNDIIEKAITIYQIGKYFEFGVEPSPLSDGGINLTFFINDNFLDVNVNFDNTLDIRIEKVYGKPYEILFKKNNVSMSLIEQYLIEIKSTCDITLGHSPCY